MSHSETESASARRRIKRVHHITCGKAPGSMMFKPLEEKLPYTLVLDTSGKQIPDAYLNMNTVFFSDSSFRVLLALV